MFLAYPTPRQIGIRLGVDQAPGRIAMERNPKYSASFRVPDITMEVSFLAFLLRLMNPFHVSFHVALSCESLPTTVQNTLIPLLPGVSFDMCNKI